MTADQIRQVMRANVGDAYNLLTQGESPTQKRGPSAQRIYDRSIQAVADLEGAVILTAEQAEKVRSFVSASPDGWHNESCYHDPCERCKALAVLRGQDAEKADG